jgi:hypothetical protein
MKVCWKDLRLKVVDAVDRGMARQGVAPTREALGETNPDALSHQSSWRTKRDGFHTTATNHRINTNGDRCKRVSEKSSVPCWNALWERCGRVLTSIYQGLGPLVATPWLHAPTLLRHPLRA